MACSPITIDGRLHNAIYLEFDAASGNLSAMRVLTDDPDWARDVYEARVLALTFLRRYGRAQLVGTPWQCLEAQHGGITVTIYPRRSPILLTIDAPGQSAEMFGRVLTLEYEAASAWRIIIETFHPGRWQRRLKTMAHPRPWLERWRALVTFTATLPRARSTSTMS
jgi:hypothetical protein